MSQFRNDAHGRVNPSGLPTSDEVGVQFVASLAVHLSQLLFLMLFLAAAPVPESIPFPGRAIRVLLPPFDCTKYESKENSRSIHLGVVSALIQRFHGRAEAEAFVHSFINDHPVRPDTVETRDILKEALLAGLWCGKMMDRAPASTMKILQECGPRKKHIPTKYPGLRWIGDEILCSVHGLEKLDARVHRYIREKAIMDVGGFTGDSAVLFSDYAKEVYSFEPGPANFKGLSNVADLNRNHFGKIHPVNLGLSEKPGQIAFDDVQTGDTAVGKGNSIVNLTTLDLFVDQNGIQVGFIKCDTEGHALPIIRGAEKTLKKQRPVLALAVYHNADEMFGIPPLLKQWLPNYHFAWNMAVSEIRKWNELLYIGYPEEALNS
jgi:FkbM family methyltransferase